MASTQQARPSFRTGEFELVAANLNLPEGPFYCADGSLLVVQIGSGLLTRIDLASRQVTTVANLGGGPNGCAVGPDGAIYVCNDGGFFSVPVQQSSGGTIQVALSQPANYSGGKIQRVAKDGTVSTLYTQFGGLDNPAKTWPLRSPDDLVFDSGGCFWFTDWGKDRLDQRNRDITGVYYAQADGNSIEEKIFPLKCPNGIALSEDESRLYVAESWTRRILFWELSGPGVIKKNPATMDGSYLLTAKIPFQAGLDSMSMDQEGNLYAVSMLPDGADPNAKGGVTVVSPGGEILEWMEIDFGQPDPLPSNICFGGPNRQTAYITLSGTGRVVSCPMAIPGKKPAFE